MGRHIDIVPNKDKFIENLETPGYYTAPWVVYIGSDNGGMMWHTHQMKSEYYLKLIM